MFETMLYQQACLPSSLADQAMRETALMIDRLAGPILGGSQALQIIISPTNTNAAKSTACATIYKALTPNNPRPTNNVSRKSIERCTATINEYYITHLNNLTRHARMPESNNLDSIFNDGRLDNSPFDLMVDIYRIKQKMFASDTVTAPPSMIMYDMPMMYDITNPGSRGGFDFGGGEIGDSASPLSSMRNPSDPTYLDTNTNASDLLAGMGGGDPVDYLSTRGASSTSIGAKQSIHPGNTSNDILPAPLCPTDIKSVGSMTNQPAIGKAGNAGASIYTPTDITDAIIAKRATSNSGLANAFATIPSNTLQSATGLPVLPETRACDDESSSRGRVSCQAQACMATCSAKYRGTDLVLCLSQCLCGQIRASNDIYVLRFCRVPAKPVVIQTQPISSIQDIVSSLFSILKSTQSKGVLPARVKTKEFLDSSFSQTKFSEILGFDIRVAWKNVRNTETTKEAEISQKSKLKERKKAFVGLGGTLGTNPDRNKYGMYNQRDIDDKAKQRETMIKQDVVAGNTLRAQAIMRSSTLDHQSSTHDSLVQFVRQQTFFWTQASEKVQEISAIRL